jgi:hypothetical protein
MIRLPLLVCLAAGLVACGPLDDESPPASPPSPTASASGFDADTTAVTLGAHLILHVPPPDDDSAPGRLVARRGSAEVWAATDARRAGFLSPLVADRNGNGLPDVAVTTHSGGAHCCNTTYFLEERDGGIVVLAELFTSHSGLNDLGDVDGDGRHEFAFRDAAFAYWRTSYAASPMKNVFVELGPEGIVVDKVLMGGKPYPQALVLEVKADLTALLAQEYRESRSTVALGAAPFSEERLAPLLAEPPPATVPPALVALIRRERTAAWTDRAARPANWFEPADPALWDALLEFVYTGHGAVVPGMLRDVWPAGAEGRTAFLADFHLTLLESPWWPGIRAAFDYPDDLLVGAP